MKLLQHTKISCKEQTKILSEVYQMEEHIQRNMTASIVLYIQLYSLHQINGLYTLYTTPDNNMIGNLQFSLVGFTAIEPNFAIIASKRLNIPHSNHALSKQLKEGSLVHCILLNKRICLISIVNLLV